MNVRTLHRLPGKFKSKPARQSRYLSPADVRIYLRAIFNLVKAGHSPAVVEKAFDDFIAVYKIGHIKKSPRCNEGRRPTKKLYGGITCE